jgi:flagellar basal-body rod modification protein FlgD
MISAGIVDGKVVAGSTATNTSESTVGTGSLGKDAFLQLLVTQMRYQDPLSPADNTEYISQLAQFSSLEQMQNLNQTFSNNNAFNLVGKKVIIAAGSSSGETPTYIPGVVQYAQIVDGKAYVAINETLYSVDDLYAILSDDYVDSIGNNDGSTGDSEDVGDSDGTGDDTGDDTGDSTD